MRHRLFARLALALLTLSAAAAAQATPWAFPKEIGVAGAYNRLYGTTYSADTREGLTAVVKDRGLGMRSLWSTADFRHLEMLVFDTSSTERFGLDIKGSFYSLFDPGPWTAPSRGWLPETRPLTVDLAAFLVSKGLDALTQFSFRRGSTVLNASNTYYLGTPVKDEWLFGFNDNGGLTGGDQDANEPLFCAFNTTKCSVPGGVPEPGTLLLMLAGAPALFTVARRRRARPSSVRLDDPDAARDILKGLR
jgi:hypothetical protein